MTLVWGAVLMAFGFLPWGSLLETGLTVASFPLGSLLGMFLLGTIDRRANATGAIIGMFAGLGAIIAVWRGGSVAYTWYVLIGACVTFVVGAVASRIAGGSNQPPAMRETE
jgi:Na+/proline symporter